MIHPHYSSTTNQFKRTRREKLGLKSYSSTSRIPIEPINQKLQRPVCKVCVYIYLTLWINLIPTLPRQTTRRSYRAGSSSLPGCSATKSLEVTMYSSSVWTAEVDRRGYRQATLPWSIVEWEFITAMRTYNYLQETQSTINFFLK